MQSNPQPNGSQRRVTAQVTRRQLALPCAPTSAGAARRFVAGLLEIDPSLDMTLALLVSELASNAILHAKSPFTVAVASDQGTVQVAVTDNSPSAPVVKCYDLDAVTGRGLRIVADSASRWGWEPQGDGKTVWFEIDHAVAVQVA